MIVDPRNILMFGANAFLLHLFLMVNSALAGWSLYVLLLGPMLVFPALYPRLPAAMLCLFVTGLWIDATFPSPFGLFAVAMPVGGVFVYHLRIRFRAEHNYHPVILAHAANLVFLILLTVSSGKELYAFAGFWKQVVLTSLLSHIMLLVVAPWFFNLQRLLFEIFRLDLEPDEFPNV